MGDLFDFVLMSDAENFNTRTREKENCVQRGEEREREKAIERAATMKNEGHDSVSKNIVIGTWI